MIGVLFLILVGIVVLVAVLRLLGRQTSSPRDRDFGGDLPMPTFATDGLESSPPAGTGEDPLHRHQHYAGDLCDQHRHSHHDTSCPHHDTSSHSHDSGGSHDCGSIDSSSNNN